MNLVVLIVLLCGAAARVTRLLVADSFPPIQAAREWLLDRYPDDDSWQGYLITCPWCLGVWVAGALTVAVDAHYGLPAPLLVWATAAHAAGWVVGSEDHPEPEPDPEPTGRRPITPSEV